MNEFVSWLTMEMREKSFCISMFNSIKHPLHFHALITVVPVVAKYTLTLCGCMLRFLWQHGMLRKRSYVAVITTIALDMFCSVSLLVAPSGLEGVLVCQGNHYAAIHELFFELLDPQQSMKKACEDTHFKDCTTAMQSFILRPYLPERVDWFLQSLVSKFIVISEGSYIYIVVSLLVISWNSIMMWV